MTIQRAPITARFERKFIPEPNSGCWLWLGAIVGGGYGNFSYEGRAMRAHRASLLIYEGLILTPEEFACHRCDNRACVNPAHLFVAPAAVNNADCKAKGRLRPRQGSASPFAKLLEEDARQILNDARSHREIADAFGVSSAVVSGIKTGDRWKSVTGGATDRRDLPRGEDNARAKLTADQVRIIRTDKCKAPALAEGFGVTRQQIHRIRRGEFWRHVD